MCYHILNFKYQTESVVQNVYFYTFCDYIAIKSNECVN